jgi:hypothetical protein
MISYEETIEKVKDIISQELGNKKVLEQDIAAALEIDYTAFRKNKNRNQTIPFYPIMQFLAKRKISINYFFFSQLPESLIDTTSQYVLLKYNQSTFRAGTDKKEAIEKYNYIILDKMFVNYLDIDHTSTELIIVTGNSMQPTIKNETIVFIDKSKIDHNNIEGIYAFGNNTGLYVKRIKEIDSKYHIVSDNKKYDTVIVKKEDINIIGKVTGQLGKL